MSAASSAASSSAAASPRRARWTWARTGPEQELGGQRLRPRPERGPALGRDELEALVERRRRRRQIAPEQVGAADERQRPRRLAVSPAGGRAPGRLLEQPERRLVVG